MTSMFGDVYTVEGGRRRIGVKQRLTAAFNLLQPGWTQLEKTSPGKQDNEPIVRRIITEVSLKGYFICVAA